MRPIHRCVLYAVKYGSSSSFILVILTLRDGVLSCCKRACLRLSNARQQVFQSIVLLLHLLKINVSTRSLITWDKLIMQHSLVPTLKNDPVSQLVLMGRQNKYLMQHSLVILRKHTTRISLQIVLVFQQIHKTSWNETKGFTYQD